MPHTLVIGASLARHVRLPWLGTALRKASEHLSAIIDENDMLKGMPFESINLVLCVSDDDSPRVHSEVVTGSELTLTFDVMRHEVGNARMVLLVVAHGVAAALQNYNVSSELLEKLRNP